MLRPTQRLATTLLHRRQTVRRRRVQPTRLRQTKLQPTKVEVFPTKLCPHILQSTPAKLPRRKASRSSRSAASSNCLEPTTSLSRTLETLRRAPQQPPPALPPALPRQPLPHPKPLRRNLKVTPIRSAKTRCRR